MSWFERNLGNPNIKSPLRKFLNSCESLGICRPLCRDKRIKSETQWRILKFINLGIKAFVNLTIINIWYFYLELTISPENNVILMWKYCFHVIKYLKWATNHFIQQTLFSKAWKEFDISSFIEEKVTKKKSCQYFEVILKAQLK